MSVQNITCAMTSDCKLSIRWTVYAEVHALSVCVAYNSDFTDTCRHFVIPNVSSITLDVGTGKWYVRIGAWLGEPTHGTIEWSAIYGPCPVASPRPILPEIPFNAKELPILHKQSILAGVRIHTGLPVPNFILISMSESNSGPSTPSTKYRYAQRKEYIDWEGLLYPNLYSVRVYLIGPELPKDRILQLNQGRTFHGLQCARPLQHGEAGSKTASRYESVLIRDNEAKDNVRFTSYDEYMRYKIAKAKYADKKFTP